MSAVTSSYLYAMPQRVGSWEYAIDVPWRITPGDDGVFRDNIPINITIHDANNRLYTPGCKFWTVEVSDCENPSPAEILSVKVTEKDYHGNVVKTTNYDSTWLFMSIESTVGIWHKEGNDGVLVRPAVHGGFGGTFPHRNDNIQGYQTLCGEATDTPCTANALKGVDNTSAWHAVLSYNPEKKTAGHLLLEVEVKYKNTDGKTRGLKTKLVTKIASKPLPKFDDSYAYGDLHYHAQGTDNTGEAGYSYREAMHAMNAIGLDWVVFSDHANNAEQVSFIAFDIDFGILGALVSGDLGFFGELDSYAVLSDMSPRRWRNHWRLLNNDSGYYSFGPVGANRSNEIAYPIINQRRSGTPGSNTLRVPTMILGGEVDYIPERAAVASTQRKTAKTGTVAPYIETIYDMCHFYPESRFSALAKYLDDHSNELDLFIDVTSPAQAGDNTNNLVPHPTTGTLVRQRLCKETQTAENISGENRALLKDIQGMGIGYSRQHLIHIPASANLYDAGIMGNTTNTGGATRRLKEIIETEYENAGKGYAFLAHPNAMASGYGLGRLGPDIRPLSKDQLTDAMKSPYILGLQAWNENDKVKTHIANPAVKVTASRCSSGTITIGGAQDGYRKKNNPDPKTGYTLGGECKNETMSGWYDGMLYDPLRELDDSKPLSWDEKKTSRFQETVAGFEMLDLVNLIGMQKSFIRTLPWLGNSQPRKMFIAGGSDAHGDFNHRRDGIASGTESINNTAMGTPRNLVMVGDPEGREVISLEGNQQFEGRAYSHEQIVAGLKSGNFSVTDGPAVRIAIDTNKNGIIDSGDTPMGGTLVAQGYGSLQNQVIDILVEFKSTADFGHVDRVMLFMGGVNDAQGSSVRYGPLNGPRYEPSLIGANMTRWGEGQLTVPASQKVYLSSQDTSPRYSFRVHKDHAAYGKEHRVWSTTANGMEKTYGGLASTYQGIAKFTVRMADLPIVKERWDSSSGKLVQDQLFYVDRAFFRAEVSTSNTGCASGEIRVSCAPNLAVTNPVWFVNREEPVMYNE
ncbi:hypothetical protein [Rheinheimera soli]|uniref:Uncharacterized protein n=1 Tax=Rheinheimera soli TaxID=443616 RepID=A0ABU1W4X7_9GAMM|nr:hypothetical protein [Rheinheimera soli]MDR7123012.1 hypothetical protein [Rheinheimera soli]